MNYYNGSNDLEDLGDGNLEDYSAVYTTNYAAKSTDDEDTYEAEETGVTADLRYDDALASEDIFSGNIKDKKGQSVKVASSDADFIRMYQTQATEYCKRYCANGKSYTLEEYAKIVEEVHSSNPMIAEEGKNKMLFSVVRFVINVGAKKYPTFFQKHSMDMVQEALMEVTKAIYTYKADKTLFTTYATGFIRHGYSNYISRIVQNTSNHYTQNSRDINRKIEDKVKKGLKWSIDDISIENDMSPTTIAECIKQNKYNAERQSIDQPVTDDGASLIDSISSPDTLSPEQEYLKKESEESYERLIASLSEQEQKVFTMSIGYYDGRAMSFAAIAEELELPKQDIRQIYNLAVYKMQGMARKDKSFTQERRERQSNNSFSYLANKDSMQSLLDEFDFDDIF